MYQAAVLKHSFQIHWYRGNGDGRRCNDRLSYRLAIWRCNYRWRRLDYWFRCGCSNRYGRNYWRGNRQYGFCLSWRLHFWGKGLYLRLHRSR